MKKYKGLIVPETTTKRYEKDYNFQYCANATCGGKGLKCFKCLFDGVNNNMFKEWNEQQPTNQEFLNDIAESTESHTKLILEHLRGGKTISVDTIPRHIKTTYLPARIGDIKKILLGSEECVNSRYKKLNNSRVKEYWIENIKRK